MIADAPQELCYSEIGPNVTDFRSKALIALGGNLSAGESDPAATLVAAVVAMAENGLVIRAVSRFFTTPCFPAGAGPDYVNAAVALDTDLPPEALLACLHGIEQQFGRARTQRWGMRTLDLDVIAIGDQILPDAAEQTKWRDLPVQAQVQAAPDQLILPHPRLQDRAFVLVPLMDIAPDWRHPILKCTVADLLAALPGAEIAAVHAI